MLLLDVTPLSLGIETLGGVVSDADPAQHHDPDDRATRFTTSVDGQTAVDMHVLQGERELAKDYRSLARFELRGIAPMPARHAEDRGDVPDRRQRHPEVQAKELRTGKAPRSRCKPTYGLSEAEVERMVEDSFTYAEADVETRGC